MRWHKALAIPVAFALSIGLWLTLQPNLNPATKPNQADTASFQWAYTNGQVIGPNQINAQQGQLVKFIITSDVHEQLRVHGYEEWVTLPAQHPTTFELMANHSGLYRLELDQSRRTLAQLHVHPAPRHRVRQLADQPNQGASK